MEKFQVSLEYQLKNEMQQEKERIFETLIINDLISVFAADLENADFESKDIELFEEELSKLPESEQKGILSIPRELRMRNFPKYQKQLENGRLTIHDLVINLANEATQKEYTLGFHTSETKIEPTQQDEWNIKGTELDDRDSMLMAYYSLDYKNAYRQDRGNRLYVIRAETSPDSTHKRDTSNNWGRAPSLSIVQELNFGYVDQEVERIYNERKKDSNFKEEEKSAA